MHCKAITTYKSSSIADVEKTTYEIFSIVSFRLLNTIFTCKVISELLLKYLKVIFKTGF